MTIKPENIRAMLDHCLWTTGIPEETAVVVEIGGYAYDIQGQDLFIEWDEDTRPTPAPPPVDIFMEHT